MSKLTAAGSAMSASGPLPEARCL
ncbi:Protein of unknown function [Lactobacillus delbrueckii subsp. lactis]|nr:Protein of unknown function [Lactobacillus delbrueckii subsp. lactis]